MSESSLGVEVQIAKPAQSKSEPTKPEFDRDVFDEAVEASRLTPEIQELIQRMMEGTEPYGRDLKHWEVVKFAPWHVNICTLRAAGFKVVEVAQIVGSAPANVSVVLRHPYGVKLVQALVPRGTIKVFDIKTRLEDYASDLLDKTHKLAMESQDVGEVSKVTFGLLDRAGYQPKPPEGAKAPGSLLGDSTLRRLTAALGESSQVDSEVMPGWRPRRPPEEGALPAGDEVGSSGEEPQVEELGQSVRAAGGTK